MIMRRFFYNLKKQNLTYSTVFLKAIKQTNQRDVHRNFVVKVLEWGLKKQDLHPNQSAGIRVGLTGVGFVILFV